MPNPVKRWTNHMWTASILVYITFGLRPIRLWEESRVHAFQRFGMTITRCLSRPRIIKRRVRHSLQNVYTHRTLRQMDAFRYSQSFFFFYFVLETVFKCITNRKTHTEKTNNNTRFEHEPLPSGKCLWFSISIRTETVGSKQYVSPTKNLYTYNGMRLIRIVSNQYYSYFEMYYRGLHFSPVRAPRFYVLFLRRVVVVGNKHYI